mgnify:FL=1
MAAFLNRIFCNRLLPAALLLATLQGCATESAAVRDQMDPVTSVTVSYSQTPLVFYRDVSGRAAYARDFVHLGPVEVNRSGDYRYYLWLGIWNTMEDAQLGPSRDGFESIIVFADGEPLPLEVAGWTIAAIGASEPVYLKPVASAADAYYAVTIDQIRLIAEAADVRIQAAGTRTRNYEPWDDQKAAKSALREFLKTSVF